MINDSADETAVVANEDAPEPWDLLRGLSCPRWLDQARLEIGDWVGRVFFSKDMTERSFV
jgi:hypothetical protein